jgi:hypothetical protein
MRFMILDQDHRVLWNASTSNSINLQMWITPSKGIPKKMGTKSLEKIQSLDFLMN